MAVDRDFLARCISAGAGREPADLVIKNIEILDVITGALTRTDVAVVGDRIVGTHATYDGQRKELRFDLAIKAFPFADTRFGRNEFSESFDPVVGETR